MAIGEIKVIEHTRPRPLWGSIIYMEKKCGFKFAVKDELSDGEYDRYLNGIEYVNGHTVKYWSLNFRTLVKRVA